MSGSTVPLLHLPPLLLPATIYWTYVTYQTLYRALHNQTCFRPHSDVLKSTSWFLFPNKHQRVATCPVITQPEGGDTFFSGPHLSSSKVSVLISNSPSGLGGSVLRAKVYEPVSCILREPEFSDWDAHLMPEAPIWWQRSTVTLGHGKDRKDPSLEGWGVIPRAFPSS